MLQAFDPATQPHGGVGRDAVFAASFAVFIDIAFISPANSVVISDVFPVASAASLFA